MHNQRDHADRDAQQWEATQGVSALDDTVAAQQFCWAQAQDRTEESQVVM